ncbi:uncharacterized protein LOC110624237 [Manihot esculenta]|uniref:uncharacterized protein LOC110624237 n=1 Tax=Manihot esculenta TaxID=3983 RepID=UPI001CC52494|nr:uncharacterized protein LOC110624237 [Manihot esculenta]
MAHQILFQVHQQPNEPGYTAPPPSPPVEDTAIDISILIVVNMTAERSWMYARLIDGLLNPRYLEGINEFLEKAKTCTEYLNGDQIRCPCNRFKCQNRSFQDENTVKYHLMKHGFVQNYLVWYLHDETEVHDGYGDTDLDMSYGSDSVNHPNFNRFEDMVMDATSCHVMHNDTYEMPNSAAQKLYDMLNASKQQLWPGCETHSQLSAVSRLLNLKAEHHFSEQCFDQICELMKEMLPSDNVMTDSFYSTKRLVRGLGLPVQKIHCCANGCMIFWENDKELTRCKFYDHERFKRLKHNLGKGKSQIPYKKMYYFPITPRLQRLYASCVTAKYMTWHNDHATENGVMCHCSDAPAWKHFNQTHPTFALEARNVRLGLCTDGFQPFGQSGQQYSSWPVILTPYNLPPGMCMKDEYMFLTIIIPGPKNLKEKLDVYMQPLVQELKELWATGVNTYDAFQQNNFTMRAALIWTISDFPAYSMLSGWSTAGRTACPYCMENTDAFTLRKGGKQTWFDSHRKFLPDNHPFRRNKTSFIKNKCVSKSPPPIRTGEYLLKEIEQIGLRRVIDIDSHEINCRLSKITGWRKRSILWDLPYWSSNLIRHNLDVMHIEKNVFENIFNTVMNVEGKTKDNIKSREDLNEICRRPKLKKDPISGKYPTACYCLDNQSKVILCDWLKILKFPDGFVSNLGRCVDSRKLRLFGMKSHDCHVFMQRILPIALREFLPNNVWQPITELSNFFRELTSTTLTNEDMQRLHEQIPVILCKLERVFSPSLFDSMEHLPVHLAYEALIAGPVQYRWMYPFERYLRKLKNNVKNKARVEGSICNAYLVEEASAFSAHYFEAHVMTRHRKVPRNLHEFVSDDDIPGKLSIFKCTGRTIGKGKSRYMTEDEIQAAQTYILLNCPEVKTYIDIYVERVKSTQPNITDAVVDEKLERDFVKWFYKYAHESPNNVQNQLMQDVAKGPLRSVTTFNGYCVNGCKFNTINGNSSSNSMNFGVCIKGSNYSSEESDYYGQLVEVLRLEYPGLPIKRTVLFKCDWFDPTPNTGTKVHRQYRIVDINNKRRYSKYEPFVLASQATQVVYASYPSKRRDKNDWWAVMKVKGRPVVEVSQTSSKTYEPFQEDDIEYAERRND